MPFHINTPDCIQIIYIILFLFVKSKRETTTLKLIITWHKLRVIGDIVCVCMHVSMPLSLL